MTDKENFQEFKQIERIKNKAYYDWIRNLIIIATGLLSVIVGLKTKQSNTLPQSVIFLIIVSTLVLGILFGAAVLYGEVLVLRKYYRKKLELIYAIIYQKEKKNIYEIIDVPKIYVCFSYSCYVCFLISFISLIIYSVLREFF